MQARPRPSYQPRKLGRPPFVTDEQVAEALLKSGGIQAHAAAMLTEASGREISREALSVRISTNPHLQEAQLRARELTLDLAETKLIEGIKAGEPSLIKFYLETQGKHRGYTRRVEFAGNLTMNINDQTIADAREELLRRYERISSARLIEGPRPAEQNTELH
jgi:hypothetical protein